MATVAQFNQDNEDEDQPSTGGGGEVLNSTGADAGSSGGGGGGVASATPQQRSPSKMPNINQYLQANEGAGQRLQRGIESNVQNQASKIGQSLNTAQQDLESKYQPLQQNLGENAQNTINTAFQNPQQLLNAYNASKTQSSNQPLSSEQQQQAQQYNQFQQLRDQGYNQDIQGYGAAAQQYGQNLANQQANLQQQADASKTEMGRFGLLQQTLGRPNYSTGQQTLDALFLQAQPGVARQLQQNLGQTAQQTGQAINTVGSDVQNKLAALQGLSSQNAQNIQSMFGQGLNDIKSNVEQQYAADQARAATLPQLQERLAGNNLTPEDIQQLGLGDLQGQHIYDLNLSNYFNQQAPKETLAQAASPEQFARYNALNQLAGGPNGLQASIFGSATEAGGYDPFGFQKERFMSDAANAQKAYEQTAAQDELQNLWRAVQPPETGGAGFQSKRYDTYAGLRDQLAPYMAAGEKNRITSTQLQDIVNNFNSYLDQSLGTKWGRHEAPSRTYQDYLNKYKKYSGNIIGGSGKEYTGKDNTMPYAPAPVDKAPSKKEEDGIQDD